jgi:hypothetical protein
VDDAKWNGGGCDGRWEKGREKQKSLGRFTAGKLSPGKRGSGYGNARKVPGPKFDSVGRSASPGQSHIGWDTGKAQESEKGKEYQGRRYRGQTLDPEWK